MKGFRLFTIGFFLGTILLSGCNNTAKPDEDQKEANPVINEKSNKTADETQSNQGTETIKNGVDEVLQSINALEQEVSVGEGSAKIQEIGKEISSTWDSIEKQVEEAYPDWYERIEKNLYPLIGESGNPEKDIKKINKLSKATKEDLQLFLEEVK
ncbi:hypothetical protein CN689_02265 [Peribacillus butanolivorans]|uniref:Lipoprotein n=1 Tax=Peribacillus butanolivorans TaxID=421767 RepID=A0AAX0S7U5_9BACI|nr:hypothetical protein [Peribacillus butanolivorans]AXN41051.1 hypothetical protein DTO10_23535 [Peribacillus butanolivorans]PEJ37740.1 hypothetical protein CN689_02265 [Peribacillus butanolivorans]